MDLIRDTTTDTVMRDRNHPSIILWSAGNEIHDTPKPDVAHAHPQRTLVAGLPRQRLPPRPVSPGALPVPTPATTTTYGLADLLDVVGQNYREQEILAAHAQKPSRKIIGTENTHDRNQWVAMRDHPEYSGQFLWAGIDYLGEAGRWPTIGSGSGLLLSNAITRPRALERQSWWSTTPMVAIMRRVSGRRATLRSIPAYANATSTDLIRTTRTASRATASNTAGTSSASSRNDSHILSAAKDPVFEFSRTKSDTSRRIDQFDLSRVRFSQPLLADWSPRDTPTYTEDVEVYTNAQEVELFLNGKSPVHAETPRRRQPHHL